MPNLNYKKTIALLSTILMSAVLISLFTGRYALSLKDVIYDTNSNSTLVLLNIRLPRILGALLVGIALSTAGVSYQTLFKNPMASPSILGASSGAAFGALLAIFFQMSYFAVILCAFFFGLISILLALILSRQFKIDPILGLLLTGLVIGSLFQGLISLLKLLADPLKTLPEMTYWLFGSLSGIGYQELGFASIIITTSWIGIYSISYRLNVLSIGMAEAKTMGISTRLLIVITVICATLLTASSIAISGMIGWIGLIIPHIARRIAGHDLKNLIPVSSLIGGIFLILVDTLSRTLHTAEIPMGILISFVGAPMFLWILVKRRAHFYD